MFHQFEEGCNKWFNTYHVLCPCAVENKNNRRIVQFPKQTIPEIPSFTSGPFFLLSYHGMMASYRGHIITDGKHYAYAVESSDPNSDDLYAVFDKLEGATLNTYCRSLIRRAILEYLEECEGWNAVWSKVEALATPTPKKPPHHFLDV